MRRRGSGRRLKFERAGTRGRMREVFVRWVLAVAPSVVVGVASLGASATTPAGVEHAACIKLRDEKMAVAAAQHCRAAYDLLPLEATEAALHDRAAIVFDSHHTYQEAFAATGEHAYLCDEAALLRRFLSDLDRLVDAQARQADRRDARRLLAQIAAQLGVHACAEPTDDALLVVTNTGRKNNAEMSENRPEAPPTAPPAPARRPLRIAGGVVLGVGLVLGMATIGALAFGEQIQHERDALLSASYTPGEVAADAEQRATELRAAGVRANLIAAGLGAAAGASLVSGVTMLAVDGARQRRSRLALHLSAWPVTGLRAALEF